MQLLLSHILSYICLLMRRSLIRRRGKEPYKIEITEVTDANGDATVDLSDVEYLLRNNKNALTLLNEDGDFRSRECIALLNECDIVVTNPPFL